MNPYETAAYLNEYLFFHYGKPRDFCPYPFAPQESLDFQQRVVQECLSAIRFPSPTRGLDIGCAVGRSTFELARVVDQAVGIDNSRIFIRAARRMARKRTMSIRVKEEGGICSTRTVRLPKRLGGLDVRFQVGDALKLPRNLDHSFHVVLAVNLIDRLPSPRRFLARLSELVVPGGQVVISSPYTWMDEYTPRREWLSLQRRSATETLDALLNPWFRLVRRRDLPFLIREHRRKYQWCVSEASTYVRTPR